MARVQITIDDACDACWTKDKTPRESVVEFTLDGRTWFLCAEHERKLAQQMTGVLGDPTENGEDK